MNKYDEEKHQAFVEDLDKVLSQTRGLLISKNKAYGDSALNPIQILSKADPRQLILSRIDDKLSRLVQGEAAGEDVWADLRGYFVLLGIYDMRVERGDRRISNRRSLEGLVEAARAEEYVRSIP